MLNCPAEDQEEMQQGAKQRMSVALSASQTGPSELWGALRLLFLNAVALVERKHQERKEKRLM